jgi:hypothetical protein
MDNEKVFYNGEWIYPQWIGRTERAQKIKSISIGGKKYPRIKYGNGGSELYADFTTCGDCGVKLGQYHVPPCDLERCPKCKGQAISCCCDYD